ncbi:MAG: hypothetical protein ACO1OB_16035 [Archangium sp.]
MLREALLELLTAWREAPNVELADRIVALGALSTTAVTHKTWFDIAIHKRAEDVSPLLAIAAVGKSAVLRERIEVLSRFPEDPRIERFVSGLYARPPVTSSSARGVWAAVRPLASRIRDASAASALRRLRDGLVAGSDWNEYLRGQLDRVLLEATVRNEPLSPALDARLLEIDQTFLAPKARDPRSWETLQTAFLEAPHDEGLRAVTMDALLEAAHPRATLMELQAGGADVAKFVKANAAVLLGPLAGVIKPNAVFARGWLQEAELRQGGSTAQRLAREATAGHPFWSTVETLSGPGDALISVHPVMKSLRALKRSQVRVPELPAQLERLLEYRLERGDVLRLAQPEVLPRLRDLYVRMYPADVALLMRRAAGLERFRADVYGMPRSVGPVVDVLFNLEGPGVTVGFLPGDGLATMTLSFEREGAAVAAHLSTPLALQPTALSECEWLLQRCRALGAVRITLQLDPAVDPGPLAALADEVR